MSFVMIPSAAFWLVGFRPFFSLACIAGALLPVVWIGLFHGAWTLPTAYFSATQWHAHEMFFGFAWAVLGGFLLTSSKNWVKIRGYHGNPLRFLVAAWLIERVGMSYAAGLPQWIFWLSNNLFLLSIISLLLWTLIKHRKTDSYRDNYFFLIILPAFLIAKNLLLNPEYFQLGVSMTMGLFRMAFLLMLERTLPPFMQSAFQITLYRNPKLDLAIKGLALPLIFAPLLPVALNSYLSLILALLLSLRFVLWTPWLAAKKLEIAVMYLGYLAITLQLFHNYLPTVWIGSLSIHLFTFGAMGLIIPAMLIRIAKGHTGRKVVFDPIDQVALYCMLLAFALRIVAPQFFPSAYLLWMSAAAACWFICFSLLAWRYIPYFLQPRIDGKEH